MNIKQSTIEEIIKSEKEKITNPNKLPFLQAQVLQKIYLDLFDHKRITIEELSKLTDYPKNSKILNDAIESLDKKGFLDYVAGIGVRDIRLKIDRFYLMKSELRPEGPVYKVIEEYVGKK